eukprot:TRINITY_DN21092_c0_g1_i1.p1 TRINITY_DN21092_c0_g1~~TRINITY_DN21092_c0_g1_i1.p1  ORF type:complete len:364 (+),score=1.78 TRINITY_DN21092_c0_g1_i1:3-1094(+)
MTLRGLPAFRDMDVPPRLAGPYSVLDCAFTDFLTKLESVTALIHEQRDSFRTHRHEQAIKVQQAAVMSEQKVVLNVGGTVFQTTQDTLLSESETFFWAMLHSGQWNPDQNGQYFIDRSPDTFPYVLEYLRSHNRVPTQGVSQEIVELLERDMDFYQINSYFLPQTPVQWGTPQADQSVQVLDNGATLSRIRPNNTGTWYIAKFVDGVGNNEASGCSYWRIVGTATSMSSQFSGNVGLGSKTGPTANSRIAVGWNSGNIFEAAVSDGKPCFSWNNAVQRTVDFCFNRNNQTLVVCAMGCCTVCPVPAELVAEMVPVAWWFPQATGVNLQFQEVPPGALIHQQQRNTAQLLSCRHDNTGGPLEVP